MKIYTILITCNYDGEQLELFTSLSDLVRFAQKEFDDAVNFGYGLHHDDVLDEDDEKEIEDLYENDYPTYKRVKEAIAQSLDGYNQWDTEINSDYSWHCLISMYDTTEKYENGALTNW